MVVSVVATVSCDWKAGLNLSWRKFSHVMVVEKYVASLGNQVVAHGPAVPLLHLVSRKAAFFLLVLNTLLLNLNCVLYWRMKVSSLSYWLSNKKTNTLNAGVDMVTTGTGSGETGTGGGETGTGGGEAEPATDRSGVWIWRGGNSSSGIHPKVVVQYSHLLLVGLNWIQRFL